MKKIQLIISSIIVILVFAAESQVYHADVIDMSLNNPQEISLQERLHLQQQTFENQQKSGTHQNQSKLESLQQLKRSRKQHLKEMESKQQGSQSQRILQENPQKEHHQRQEQVQQKLQKLQTYRKPLESQPRIIRQSQQPVRTSFLNMTKKLSSTKNRTNFFSRPDNPFLAAATIRATSVKPFTKTSSPLFSSNEMVQPTASASATSEASSLSNSFEMSGSGGIMDTLKRKPVEYLDPNILNENNDFAAFNSENSDAVAVAFSSSFTSVAHSSSSFINLENTVQWVTPHRPQLNHYRNFAEIFNEIDQKAETDYNSSVENDEMNDDFNGRSVVSPGQYPHMTALGYRKSTGDTEFKCGGSLISEMFVLTAAHCCFLNGQAPHLVQIGDIKLKEFEHNIIPQRRGIARVIKHPYYNESLYYNDIGLLELTNPIVYTYFVRPIRLWAQDEIPYSKVFTMGYGSTSFAQAPTNVLTELDLSIVPLETCNKTMPSGPHAPYGLAESQICAKDFEKNRDTCQGDSGGPLQLCLERTSSRHLRYYLVGIISYGTFCRSQYPGVYTRVSSYIDWIASEVWPNYFKNFH